VSFFILLFVILLEDLERLLWFESIMEKSDVLQTE